VCSICGTHRTGTAPGRPDGVPVTAGGPLPAPQDRWVLRDFTGGTGRERVPDKDFEDEPLIAVLTSPFTGPMGDLHVARPCNASSSPPHLTVLPCPSYRSSWRYPTSATRCSG